MKAYNPQRRVGVRLNHVGTNDAIDGLDEVPSLTPQDVAAATGLSYHAVLRTIHRGELVAYKLCGRVRLRKEDVMAWVERCRVELEELGPPPPAPPPAQGSLDALRELERRRRS